MRPKISVIIPVYNGEKYISEAIESVLQQSYLGEIEVIIIDDGSQDNSRQVIQGYGNQLRYYYQENQGLGAARNAGIQQVTGTLVAFLDADDVWSKDKLAKQVQALSQCADVDMVFGCVRQFRSPELNKEEIKFVGEGDVFSGIIAGTLLVSKEALLRVGEFSNDVHVGEFIDWYARAKELGISHVMVEDVVMHRRLHQQNMGVLFKDKRKDFLKVLKASLDRRRAG